MRTALNAAAMHFERNRPNVEGSSAHAQAALPMSAFSDGNPAYLWVPLSRPLTTDASTSRKGPSVTAAAAMPMAASGPAEAAGELRVRVHWVAEEDAEGVSGAAEGGQPEPGGGAAWRGHLHR